VVSRLVEVDETELERLVVVDVIVVRDVAEHDLGTLPVNVDGLDPAVRDRFEIAGSANSLALVGKRHIFSVLLYSP
jgi:hypothetical protein